MESNHGNAISKECQQYIATIRTRTAITISDPPCSDDIYKTIAGLPTAPHFLATMEFLSVFPALYQLTFVPPAVVQVVHSAIIIITSFLKSTSVVNLQQCC